MNNQIEIRVNLLKYYISRLTDNMLENRPYYIAIEIALKQIQKLLEKELLIFFTEDIKNLPQEYKKQSPKDTLKELAKEHGVIPIDTEDMNTNKDKILVIDINYLPSDFREGTISDTKKRLEEDYKMKVLLIDSSKQNIQGATGLRPIYTI